MSIFFSFINLIKVKLIVCKRSNSKLSNFYTKLKIKVKLYKEGQGWAGENLHDYSEKCCMM